MTDDNNSAAGWTENDAQLWARNNGILLQIEQEYNDDMEAGKVLSQNVAEGTQVKKGEFVKLTVSLGHDLSVTFPIPDIMSMTKNEIDTWAAENFMTKVRVTTEFSDLVESGKVIRFEINDNTVVNEVRRDSPVYVIISKGPEDVTAANIEVNLMTAGAGICHSEVSTTDTTVLHGVQLWTVLPDSDRHGPRRFDHHAPEPVDFDGGQALVFLGSLLGETSPVTTLDRKSVV